MSEQQKILRVMQLITYLRKPYGISKKSICNQLEMSVRTAERYILLLKDLGFQIEKTNGYFKIQSFSKDEAFDDAIVFTNEEAAIIRDSILGQAGKDPVTDSIIMKISALTELEDFSAALGSGMTSRNIKHIREAIEAKKQVQLCGYHSVSSSTVSNRLVEPIRICNFFHYLLAYEISSGQTKQFKIERISEAKIMEQSWKHAEKHQQPNVDIFGMSGTEPIDVELILNDRAKCLMSEEIREADQFLYSHKGIHRYKGHVYSFEGIARFVMGLPGQIQIISPLELKVFVREKMEEWMKENGEEMPELM
jgi:predicted DNA-binding transcriptional regulator YafY